MSAKHVDVVIAGAGVAGLQAANTLAEHGLSVMVVESSDRVGGRIHTAYTASGEPVELGAEFVHGRQPRTLAWLERAGLSLAQADDRITWLFNGQPQPLDSVIEGYAIIEGITKFQGADVPASDYLDALARQYSPAAIQFARRYIEGFNAARQEKISTLWVAKTEAELDANGGEHNYRVVQGYERLPRFMADEARHLGVTFRLGHSVSKILLTGDGVEVHTAAGDILTASACVVALPLATIQKKQSHLLPHAHALMDALASLEPGFTYKVSLEFQVPHWPTDVGYIFSSPPDIQTWWTRPGSSVITAWFPPERAEQAPFTVPQLREKTLTSLASVLGIAQHTLESTLVAMHQKVWHGAAEFGLAYSYVRVHQLAAPARLAALDLPGIYFAGEHCAPGYAQGTVHGALASGEAAAERVIHDLSGTR